MGAEYSHQGKTAVGRHLIYEAVAVMEDFMCSLNVLHVVVENKQPGRIIHQTVHATAMADKHQRKSVMIVTVVAINK